MSFLGSSIITVLVGPPEVNGDRHKLHIQKDKIIGHSHFFASALSGCWRNTESNTVDIYKFDADILPEDIARYLETVYTHHPLKYSLEHICHVYIIAQALLDLRTCKQCVVAVYSRLEREGDVTEYPNMACIKQIYANAATSKKPMRRLLADFWYDSAKPEWYVGGMEEAPKEFLWQLAQTSTSVMHEKDLGNLEKFLEGEDEGRETGAGEEES
jgi:hypothetical protein